MASVDAETLLQDCLKAGLEVSVEHGGLVVRGPYVPELFDQLKKHKSAVLELLQQRKWATHVLSRTAVNVIRQWAEKHNWPEIRLGSGRNVGPGETRWQSLLKFLTIPSAGPIVRQEQLRLCQEVCMRIAHDAPDVTWLGATTAALWAWGELNDWPPLRIPSDPPLVLQGKADWDTLWLALQSEQLSPCELVAIVSVLAQQAGLVSSRQR